MSASRQAISVNLSEGEHLQSGKRNRSNIHPTDL